MEKYGYLIPISNSDFGSVTSSKDFTEAIKYMQIYMNLPETGVLDEATKKKMYSPRCGIKEDKRSRNKRYSIQGQQWRKTHLTWRLNIFLIHLT